MGTVVLMHKELKIGTLRGVLKLAKVDVDAFSKYIWCLKNFLNHLVGKIGILFLPKRSHKMGETSKVWLKNFPRYPVRYNKCLYTLQAPYRFFEIKW